MPKVIRRHDIKNMIRRRKELAYMHFSFQNSVDGEPSAIPSKIYKKGRKNIDELIYNIDLELHKYITEREAGIWLLQIKGMDLQLAAGFLAYFDAVGKSTAAQFIKYAGVNNMSAPHNNEAADILDEFMKRILSIQDSLYFDIYTTKYNIDISKGYEPSHAAVRALRYTKKVFLAHLFEEMYRVENNEPPVRTGESSNVVIEPEIPYTR